jgi:hypothetical protein
LLACFSRQFQVLFQVGLNVPKSCIDLGEGKLKVHR